MEISEIRAFANETLTDNGEGKIVGSDLRTAIVELCDQVESLPMWKPVFGLAAGPADSVVMKVVTWLDGPNNMPPQNLYLGGTGLTSDIASAINVRGLKGNKPNHVWSGTKLTFENPDGTPGAEVDLKGATGDKWVNWRGAWTASTVYAAGDGVQNGGNSYRRKAAGTSGTVFDPTNWDLVAQGGAPADKAVTKAKLGDDVSFDLTSIDTLTKNTTGILLRLLNGPFSAVRYNSSNTLLATPTLTQTFNVDRSCRLTGPTDNNNDFDITYLDTTISGLTSFSKISLSATVQSLLSSSPYIGIGFMSASGEVGLVYRSTGFIHLALKGQLSTQLAPADPTRAFVAGDVVRVELMIGTAGAITVRTAKNNTYGATYSIANVPTGNLLVCIRGAIDVTYSLTTEQVSLIGQQIAQGMGAANSYTDAKVTPVTALLLDSTQLLPSNTFVQDSYYLRSSGQIAAVAGWIRTGLIPVPANTTLTLSGINCRFVGNEYGAAGVSAFLSNLSIDNTATPFTKLTFTTGPNTAFLGLNITDPATPNKTATAKLELGAVATPWEAYGGKSLDGSKLKSVDATKIVGQIPDVVYSANMAKNFPELFISYNLTGYLGHELFAVFVKYASDSTYYIRYQLARVVGTRQDMWRIVGADLYQYVLDSYFVGTMVNLNKNLITNGENESVYKQTGKSDFTGGVHGDEIKTDVQFMLNGVPLTSAELSVNFSMRSAVSFEYIQKSNMYEKDNSTDVIQAQHLKVTSFVRGGYDTRNKLTWLIGGLNIQVWYCGICCIAPAQAEVVYSENCDYATLVRTAGSETEYLNATGLRELHYYSASNNLGAVVSSTILQPSAQDVNAVLSYKDNTLYAKYYRGLKNFATTVNAVYESKMSVRHLVR